MSDLRSQHTIRVITTEGVVKVRMADLSASDRSLIGQHWNAVQRAVRTGTTDDYINTDGQLIRGLDYFRGRTVGS